MKRLNVKAGALQFVLFLGICTFVLLLSFLLFLRLQDQVSTKTLNYISAIECSESGIHDALLNKINPEADYNIRYGKWGVYDLIQSSVSILEKPFAKVCLVGFKPPKKALILGASPTSKLTLVGNTKVKGDVHIPQGQIKRGIIEGRSFLSDTLIHGSILTSRGFPAVDQYSFEIKEFSQYTYKPNIDTVKQSFKSPAKVFYSNDPIDLIDQSYVGHIIIESAQKITVEKNTYLEDIILKAPIIVLKDDVQGTFQCLASKAIEVKANVHLDYPSALVLKNVDGKGAVTLNEGSYIKGTIAYFNKDYHISKTDNPHIIISSGAKVYGEVFSNGLVEHKGKVIGSIFAKEFLLNSSGYKYKNHVMDAVIDYPKRLEDYVGIVPDNGEKRKAIMKWLY